ncbi:MAG: endolytic transglycosylase MltG [Beijerinckiaceae bacterium]|nr:endolytic transglycosylase MltG [Beijerinckiaceae bacterium]
MTPQSPNEALQPEAAPPPPPLPPRPKRRRLSALSGFLSFVLIAAIGAMVGIVLGEARLREPGPLAVDKVVFIQKGSSEDIVDKLAEEGVIDSPIVFQIALALKNLSGDKERLKAGEYLFKRQASVDDVLATLVAGKQILHAITIPEGLTSQQVVQRIHDSDVLTGEIRDAPKEGSILPETYKVARGTTRAELLLKMKDDQRRAVEQIWARRAPDLPLRSPYELVTLASIVEKETGKADERSRVAAVFINRLKKRMRLQSDPTIVYGLVGGQGTLGHSISRAELDKPTPYNTYTIDGLPPGPIDNPGRAALEAVANPSRTADLYFVADGTGGHAFAETIEQHAKNVQRWRQLEHDAKEKTTNDIDKVEPSAVPLVPPKSNQRTDASGSVFGGLPSRSDVTEPKMHVLSFLDPAAPVSLKAFSSMDLDGARRKPAVKEKPSAPLSFGAGFDPDGLSIKGARPGPGALDGPVDSVSDDPSPGAPDGVAKSAGASGDEARNGPAKQPPEHPKIFDVSEGTALDPLRAKDYDLNSAKTVPVLGTMPTP